MEPDTTVNEECRACARAFRLTPKNPTPNTVLTMLTQVNVLLTMLSRRGATMTVIGGARSSNPESAGRRFANRK